MAAADDLALLERVFLRIGTAETDEQLEASLCKFLPPVLLKLCSPEEVVRKKVMELLIHVNKRLKSRPKVKLPVDALLMQYQDPTSSPFVTNFSILYIKMGYPRMEIEEQAQKAPILISCLENKPVSQQDSLLQLLLPVLGHIKFPETIEKRKAMFTFSDQPETSKLFLEFLLDVLLLPYSFPPASANVKTTTTIPSSGQNTSWDNPVPSTSTAPDPTSTAPVPTVPPGLSEYAYKRAQGDSPLSADNLEKAKMGILRFLGAYVFPEQDMICHFVVGTSDTRHRVVALAEMALKRMAGSTDWNDPAVFKKLFDLFLGTIQLGEGQESNVNKAHKRMSGSMRIRLKIFPQLLKSREAVNTYPQVLHTIYDCLYGATTNHKLKKYAVQFIHHLCLYSSDKNMAAIGPLLITYMLNLIRDSPEDGKLRNLAYVALGKLGKCVPEVVCNNIGLVQKLFDAISKEDSETRLGVLETLSILSTSFRNMKDSNKVLMEALIIQNFEKDETQARIMAVKYSQTVFPPDHVSSRYLLLLACGDVKEEIYSEAMKALRALPSEEDEDELSEGKQQAHLPKFEHMINYITTKAKERLSNDQAYSIGTHVLPFNPVTCGEMLLYLRTCLANDAGVRSNLESLNAMQADSPVIAKHTLKLLTADPRETGPVQQYIGLIIQLLRAIGGPPAMFCLIEVYAGASEFLTSKIVEHIDWIKKLIFSSKEDMRILAAQLYAMVICCTRSQSEIQTVIEKFIKNMSAKSFETQHGSILATGYLIAQQNRKTMVLEDVESEESNAQYAACVVSALKRIASFLKDRDEQLLLEACSTLGEIGRSGSLPLPSGDENDSEGHITKMSLVKGLLSVKNKEKAAMSLGYLCSGEVDFPHHRYIIEHLTESVQSKQVALHFGIGEAMVYCAHGSASPVSRNLWLQTEQEYQKSVPGEGDIDWYLKLVLKKYVGNKNPFLRQASCIWLLFLVKKCGYCSAIQNALTHIQGAFMKLLSENDDLVQDVASKGLGLVYANCSEEQRKSLVQELVDALTTGKRHTQKVEGDTQVFDQGMLGKTPEGSGLSTYKELCSIASDLNQPDLIYKFMHLANHNAMWNSRKGAAFGFSTIAAQAGEQLSPYLPEIVPKLYRYQFDPNPKIQAAMSTIWSALVKDNKKTVDTYFKEILNDLIRNLTSNQWRVRESSCLAVNDILRGRQIEDVVEQLPELWESCLRVRDDIKESVRLAADAACKTLSRSSVRICDVNNGKIGEKAISLVLPCILSNSLNSQVEEVRAIGLSTILKISMNAGALLKPHIPVLVVALLEAVSGLEPQMLNYLSLHANRNQASQERLDTMRIAASKMSPMMETVNLCAQYVDETVLKELVPRLTDLIRGGVGVGTKAGCSNFVISLVHQCPQDLAPYTGKLMGSLLIGLHDRNGAIRKSFASALGHLAKLAKDRTVENLIERLKNWYMEKDDEIAHEACGVTLQAISHHSSDVLKKHGALAMPLAFFAMHEKRGEDGERLTASKYEEEEETTAWQEVWLDTTPGTEGGLRLYLQETVQLLCVAIESPSWHTKAQAASAISTMASKLGVNLGTPHLGTILTALLGALSGRTWTGKETVLQALSVVCTSCSLNADTTSGGQPTTDQVIEAVLKECRKENLMYKSEAIRCLGGILNTYSMDRFEDTWEILIPRLDKKPNSEDDNEEEEEEESHSLEEIIHFEEVGYEVIGQAWPSVQQTQDLYQEEVAKLISTKLPKSVWQVQLVMLTTTKTFIKRSLLLEDPKRLSDETEVASSIVNMLLAQAIRCLGNLKYSAIRQEALSVIEIIVQKLSDTKRLDLIAISKKELMNSLSVISRNSRSELQDRAKVVEQILSVENMDWK